jgi:hypothetical protein
MIEFSDRVELRKHILRKLAKNSRETIKSIMLREARRLSAGAELQDLLECDEDTLLDVVAASPAFFELAVASLLDIEKPPIKEIDKATLLDLQGRGFDVRELLRKWASGLTDSDRREEMASLLRSECSTEDVIERFLPTLDGETRQKLNVAVAAPVLCAELLVQLVERMQRNEARATRKSPETG